MMRRLPLLLIGLWLAASSDLRASSYQNLESGQVHPIALSADGSRLLALNTPDALLEVFTLDAAGEPTPERGIPVGLEPVSVRIAPDGLAWVVNQLSDTVSLVDLDLGFVVQTLAVGDEPTDVAFAAGRAFVSSAGRDRIEVFDPPWGDAPPTPVPIATRKPRALATASVGGREVVLAIGLHSGNRTTIVNANVIFDNDGRLVQRRLDDMGLENIDCDGAPPPYPPLPEGIERDPGLPTPAGGGPPLVGLIVRWDEASQSWLDDAGQDWSHCLPVRIGDEDLFSIDALTLGSQSVRSVGTTLFDLAVQPGTQRVWISNTDARNAVRFEHALGVRGHVVDNRLTVVDLSAGPVPSVQALDLNSHVDRASDPSSNLAERLASVSQPGELVWRSDGSRAYLTAFGSAKVFELDGACLDPACLFGPDRNAPRAVDLPGGPSGLALDEARDRLYVLSRFENSLSVVEASTLTRLRDLPLHDPSSPDVRDGRVLLYDAVRSSGHGDAACSSCHVFGDRDDLAWDLGDPGVEFVSYDEEFDNVRFVEATASGPETCDPADCASQTGFDPQKGPMTTQTLRGMLEPLHWRGDRPTFASFNPAFVGLLGAADLGGGGLPPEDMELFRRFALGIRFPPNPNRNVDDTLADFDVEVPGSGFLGNPTVGLDLYDTFPTDGGASCQLCHAHPFGAGGGTLGGVTPESVTSEAAAGIFDGDDDLSFHSDMKIPHLRNMHEKRGPVFAAPGAPPVDSVGGFGFAHDGSVPDLRTFFSVDVFDVNAAQIEDIVSFLLHFPSGTRPLVGQHVTVPPGPSPSGSAEQELLLATMLGLGDADDPSRHCEAVAFVPRGGDLRRFRFASGLWQPDRLGDPALTTEELRTSAEGPISFLCAFDCDGARLGGDRDLDGHLDRDDCAPAEPGTHAPPQALGTLRVSESGGARLSWPDQSADTGPGLLHDVASGTLAGLWADGLGSAGCLATDVAGPSFLDDRDPAGDGFWYLVRARNRCGQGSGDFGRPALASLDCGP